MQIFIERLAFAAEFIPAVGLRDAIINIASCLTSEYKPLTVWPNMVSKIMIFTD